MSSVTQAPGGGSSALRFSRDAYIASPAFDWVFLIGSPLLAVAAVFVALQFFSKITIEGVVLSYVAVGHHVPTFLRAYGDPSEFNTNRFNLVAIPLLVIPLLALCFLVDARLLLLIFVWDQYHFVRQHYGISRIYDTRVGAASSRTYNLDQLLSFAGFILILSHSDFYSYIYTLYLYDFGIAIPSWIGPLIRNGSLVAAGVIGAAYVFDIVKRARAGQATSGPKLILYLTSYGVWWYAYVELGDLLLSYAISSLFHCLQYDAFAWFYNHKKSLATAADASGGALFRAVHGRGRIWLYVIAILSYGVASQLIGGFAPIVALFINRTTGVLHYYFDSYIWRVRKATFREHLG